VFRIDDDFFLDRVVDRLPREIGVEWHGTAYLVAVPAATLPLFLTLTGVSNPPPGELVLVLRQRPRLRDLFRGTAAAVSAEARARREG
jgi:hypothetical protein